MSNAGRAARAKGYGFERVIANFFQDLGFGRARRHLEFQDEEALGYDLDGTWPFVIQCKRYKKYASINKINEIDDQLAEKGIPLLITKGDHLKPMVVLPLDKFGELVKDWKGLEEAIDANKRIQG